MEHPEYVQEYCVFRTGPTEGLSGRSGVNALLGGTTTALVSDSAPCEYALPLLSEGAGLEESLRTKDKFLTLRFPRTVVASAGLVAIPIDQLLPLGPSRN